MPIAKKGGQFLGLATLWRDRPAKPGQIARLYNIILHDCIIELVHMGPLKSHEIFNSFLEHIIGQMSGLLLLIVIVTPAT